MNLVKQASQGKYISVLLNFFPIALKNTEAIALEWTSEENLKRIDTIVPENSSCCQNINVHIQNLMCTAEQATPSAPS